MDPYKNNPFCGEKSVHANKTAIASFILGFSAVLFMLIPAYTLFLAVPLGILAVMYGKKAIKNGTTKWKLAVIGKGMGIVALIGFAIEIVLAVILITIWFIRI
jgi:hypothetical protein